MLNVLGQHVEAAETYVTRKIKALSPPLIWWLKRKHNRKMGHVTLFSSEPDGVVEIQERVDF